MSALLPSEAKDDLIAGAFVCRHKAGIWNSVSVHQFGEQTAIKIGKGGLGAQMVTTLRLTWDVGFQFITEKMEHFCMMKRISPSSATRSELLTRVIRSSGFSVMTLMSSCCLYAGHGNVSCRNVALIFRWRSGMVLSWTSMRLVES